MHQKLLLFLTIVSWIWFFFDNCTSILYCHLLFVVCVYTFSSSMPCLNSLLTCSNVYYNYDVVLKLTSLVLPLNAFCFIAIIIISVVDSKSCIHEIVNNRYWLWAWSFIYQQGKISFKIHAYDKHNLSWSSVKFKYFFEIS